MYIIYAPDKKFSGKVGDFKFKNGECIAKLSENDKTWFKMSGYKIFTYNKPIEIEEIKKENVEDKKEDK